MSCFGPDGDRDEAGRLSSEAKQRPGPGGGVALGLNLRPRRAAVDFGRVLILNTLAPVFLLIALGAGLQASRFLSPGFLREANRVVYWVGLPALLFSQLARLGRGVGDATPMLGVMLVATVAASAIAGCIACAAEV